MNTIEFISHSANETEFLGAALGKSLNIGDCAALFGGLGAGKTAFARGVGAALGVSDVCSPTFTISMEHEGRIPFVHMDAYRLSSAEEFFELGLDEAFPRAAVLVEWADRIQEALPERRLELTFKEGKGDCERVIVARARGGADALLEKFVCKANVGANCVRPRAVTDRPYM